MKKCFALLIAACVILVGGTYAVASSDGEQVSARAKKTYTVKVVAGKNGKVSGKKTSKVTAGGKAQYTITPSKKYLIDTLTVNGAPKKGLPSKVGKAYSLKLAKINENTTIKVTFATKRTLSPLSVGSQITVVDAK
jgi:nitrous oxidase accessory protein NosD